MKFMVKPVIIEAVQYPLNEFADNPFTFKEDPPEWLVNAIKTGEIRPVFKTEDYWYLLCHTMQGEKLAGPDDWLVKGMTGELFVCKSDDFHSSYVRADS